MDYLQILFAMIAFLSIVSNLFLCILFFNNKTWLRKPYNVFILSLAVTDMLTGFLMFLSPGMIFKGLVDTPSNPYLGTVFCKLIWSRWLLFALGAVSVYTCLALTIERWTAICRPFKYRAKFASKRLIGYIVLVWIVGLSVSPIAAIETIHQSKTSNTTKPRCSMSPLVEGDLIGVVSVISIGLKFFIPSALILGLYVVAIVKLKRSVQNHREKALKNVTKMAAAASIALVVCWMPNQIYFALHKFRQLDLFTPMHNVLSLIVFLNSTLNPFIYGFWGKHFRIAMRKIFCCRSGDVNENKTTSPGLRGVYRANAVSIPAHDNQVFCMRETTPM